MKLLFAFLFLSSTLLADELVLNNSGTIDGAIQETPEGYRVDAGYGVFTIPKSRVRTVRYERGPVHDFNEHLEKLKNSRDIDALFELALSAQSLKMTRHVRPLLRRVLALNPRHEGARAVLNSYDAPRPASNGWQRLAEMQARDDARREREARLQYEKDVMEFYEYVAYRATGLFGGELTWPYDRQPWSSGFVPWYESRRLGFSPRWGWGF